jgi:multiple sugar transport system substrate-binding protein
VYPGVLKRFSPEGHLSVLPQDTAPMGLVYYNKKLFREAGVPYPKAGWSWPEPFLSTCKKLVKRDAAGKTVQWAYCESYVTNCTNFLWTEGGLLVDDTDKPTRLTLDSPECLKGYRFYWDMMHKLGVTPSPSNLQGFGVNDSVESMFLNGKLAMMTTGLWQVPKFLAQPGLEFDVVPFPKGPTGIKAWGTGGSGFAVAKSCRNKGLAWDLAKTLCSDEVVSQLASTGWIMPAKKSLAKSDAFLKSPGPAGKAYLPDMPEFSRYEPFLKTWTEMYYGQVYPALDPVWNGDKTPEQTLPDVTAAVNRKYFAK